MNNAHKPLMNLPMQYSQKTFRSLRRRDQVPRSGLAMQAWRRYGCAIAVLIAACATVSSAEAAARFARTTGNWSAITWSGTSCIAGTSAVPTAADAVTICDNVTVTVNTSPTVQSITIPAGANDAILQITSAQTLTVTGDVTVTAGTGTGDNKQILLSNNAVFNVNGNVTLNGNGNDDRFALLQINGASATIDGNLVIDGIVAGNDRARVTLANTSSLTVNGDITLDLGGLLDNGGSANSIIRLRGDFTQVGASNDYSSTGGVFQLDGAGAQALNGGAAVVTTFYRLIVNKTSGDVTLGHNVVVAGGAASSQFVLTQGRIITGTNSVAVGAAGATATTISGASTASYVVGNLRRYIPTGTQAGIVYPVGGSTAGKYAPVQIDFPNVTTAGYFQVAASTANTDHPNIASSVLDAANSVNRYWTLTNTGGITFSGVTTASATFNYPASDVDVSADPAAFIVGDFSGGTWTYPTTGTLTSTSTQATGLTAAAIAGDYAMAEMVGPYSYWRMNENSWNGTANEVTDFGSASNPGTAASLAATKPTTSNTTPAIAGSPGTCRYGVFNRNNKDYITLPAGYPNLAAAGSTGLSITAWIRTTDSSLPGQRIFIDDQDNVTPGGWGFSVGETDRAGAGGLRFYYRQATTFTLDTVAIPSNQWLFVAMSVSLAAGAGASRGTLYVYNTAGTLVTTYTDTFTWTPGSDPGPSSIGGETNAAGEGTNQFGFSGNIDELRIYRATLTQAMVNNVRQLTNPCITTDHYAIVGSTTGVTCDVSPVQIIAHDSTHTAVSPAAGTVLSISTSTSTGVWQPGLIVGTGAWTPTGANNGVATYVWPGGESSFTVNLRHSTVATLSINLVDSNSKGEATTEDLSIAFVDSAFRVTTNGTTTATVGTQISGKNSNIGFAAQTLYIQAIRTDTATGTCVGAIQNLSATIQMAGNRVSPTGPTASQVSVLNNLGVMVPLGTGGGTPGAYTNVALTFDGQSKAPLVINYPDAGSISLHAQYALPAPPAATFITGSSNVFVVRPFGFAFRGATAATAIQHSNSDTGTVLVPAGDNFTMTVAAYQWAAGEDSVGVVDGIPDPGVNLTNNGLTPNFAASVSIAATVNLPGVATGSITRGAACASAATIATASFINGSATISDWCYSEAGNVFLTATSTDYLGATDADITGNSGLDGGTFGGYVGRFRPKYFEIDSSAGNAPTLVNRFAASCGTGPTVTSTFTYMNEGLRLRFRLLARNTQGATTLNYNGAYAKLGIGTFTNFDFGAKSGTTSLTSRITAGSSTGSSWLSGIGTVVADFPIDRASSPDGPYTTVQFGIAPSDLDTVAMNAFNFDADGNTINERTNLGVTTEVRFGRMRLNNTFGSTLLDLPLPLSIEYYTGSGFATNAADSCTTLQNSDLRFSFQTGNLSACETAINPVTPLYFVGGRISSTPPPTLTPARLTKPGSTNDGAVDIAVNLNGVVGTIGRCTAVGGAGATATNANKPWLQGNWGTTTYNSDPTGRATFGVFKSADEFIYLREVY